MKEGESTYLYDRNGVEIKFGDRIRFFDRVGAVRRHNAVWDGTVIFEDGVPTVSILDATIVENPPDWDRPHDWTKSRHWSCQVGYGEYGTWNVEREPLTRIHTGWASYELLKPIYEKHGFDKRYLNVEVLK